MMEVYRPLRIVLFGYDLIRLMVMVRLLVSFVPLSGTQDEGVFPHLFYAVPNGLFPLITLFLWIKVSLYKPFIPLYLAGKTLAMVAVFAWIIFSRQLIAHALAVNAGGTISIVGAAMLLAIGDFLSIAGGVILKHRLDRASSVESGTPFRREVYHADNPNRER
jgi:hypothetical protein